MTSMCSEILLLLPLLLVLVLVLVLLPLLLLKLLEAVVTLLLHNTIYINEGKNQISGSSNSKKI